MLLGLAGAALASLPLSAPDAGATPTWLEAAKLSAPGQSAEAPQVAADAQGDALPAGAEKWIDARGNTRSAAALGAIVRPGEWQALWRLAQRYRKANAVLVRLARSVATRRLLDGAAGNG